MEARKLDDECPPTPKPREEGRPAHSNFSPPTSRIQLFGHVIYHMHSIPYTICGPYTIPTKSIFHLFGYGICQETSAFPGPPRARLQELWEALHAIERDEAAWRSHRFWQSGVRCPLKGLWASFRVDIYGRLRVGRIIGIWRSGVLVTGFRTVIKSYLEGP